MTLAVRVIPCLDVAAGRVVKGTRFESLRDAGDPVDAAVRYEAEGADELAFLDIAASHEERGTLVHLVERVASVLSIPFTVGGGVRAVEDAGRLLSAGADRVTVNTAALADPSLISRIAERYGSQCVVVAVDGKRVEGPGGTTRLVAMTHGGRRESDREVTEWVTEAGRRGAGEVLLTSVDADGTQVGFDLGMLRAVRAATPLPIVASGGAGRLPHFAEAVAAGADAVLAASVFHDRVYAISDVKRAMAEAGVPVRLDGGSAVPGVRFDDRGLVPVVVRDAATGQVLTLAWADAEAISATVRTGLSHFRSRSRNALWKKGETSGNVQRVTAISLDCDGDAVLYDVVPAGPACHEGLRSCFAPSVSLAPPPERPEALDLGPLFAAVADRKARPEPGSYTNRLLAEGPAKVARKVGEEAVETAIAAVSGDAASLASEVADLLYHVAVLMASRDVPPSLVQARLDERRGTRRDA
ncbi:MAG: imidazole glycerol phosphate synthase subunit HisF [Acidobacteria bacterium]|nr:MAG: imidazole glycerol phosphate synthase subunit HisF [Acidobacteriota bacterium]MCE7960319.1 imidazole glycerol phosphate synthase subunit HisF [Acidobacteria bacterium ACB2]